MSASTPAGKRRRAPWAAQPKKEQRALATKYTVNPSPKMVSLSKISMASTGHTPRVAVEQFAAANPKEFIENYARMLQTGDAKFQKRPMSFWRKHAQNALNEVKAMNEVLLREAAAKTFDDVAKHRPAAIAELQKKMRKYLEQRKIPFRKDTFEAATSLLLLGTNAMAAPASIMSPKTFEAVYLKRMKDERRDALAKLTNINAMIQRILPGKKLMKKHKDAIREIALRLGSGFAKERDRVIQATAQLNQNPANLFPEINAAIRELHKKYDDMVLAEFQKRFSAQQTKTSGAVRQQTTQKKLGSREERMSQYKPTEREIRVQNLAEGETIAKAMKTPFDPVTYSLAEIAKESASTASRLSNLMRQRQLSAENIKSLYTSGSLSQRVFLRALDSGFATRFGEENINSLARVITYIGSKGRRIDRATREFHSAQSDAMLKFLEHIGLFDTGHGGGEVVYLKRI